jgi:ATP/ADP translocase
MKIINLFSVAVIFLIVSCNKNTQNQLINVSTNNSVALDNFKGISNSLVVSKKFLFDASQG